MKNISDLQKYLRDFHGKSEFLTYEEIAKAFSIKMQTLYNDKNKGMLQPMSQNGHNVRFSSNEVFNYLIQKQIISLN